MKNKQKEYAKEHKTKEQIYKRKGFFYYAMPPVIYLALTFTLWLAWHIELSFTKVTAKLIIVLALGAMAAFRFINLFRYVINLLRCRGYCNYTIGTINDYVRVKQGCSGTGKSSTGAHESVYMADANESTLRQDYWLLKNKRDRTEREELDWLETKKAYEYYVAKDAELKAQAERNIAERNKELKQFLHMARSLPRGKEKRQSLANCRRYRAFVKRANRNEIVGCIWCLWSNIPIRVGNRVSNVATVRHLMQLDCLPKYTIFFWDEIGNTLSKYGYTQTQITQFIEELFRYPRHYNEMRIIMTEQEGNNVLIATRKNVAFLDFFTRPQRTIMRPLRYKIIKSLIDWWVEKRGYKPKAPWLIALYQHCLNMYYNLGFRIFTVKRIGNQEQAGAGQVLNQEQRRFAFATLNCEYDSRCYREGYKAKDKDVNGDVWVKLNLSQQDIEKERELRENLLSKPTIELKNELGLKLSNFDQITLAIEGTKLDYNKINDKIKKLYGHKIAISKLTQAQVDDILKAIDDYKARLQAKNNAEKI